jgi:hypothetical protein
MGEERNDNNGSTFLYGTLSNRLFSNHYLPSSLPQNWLHEPKNVDRIMFITLWSYVVNDSCTMTLYLSSAADAFQSDLIPNQPQYEVSQ